MDQVINTIEKTAAVEHFDDRLKMQLKKKIYVSPQVLGTFNSATLDSGELDN